MRNPRFTVRMSLPLLLAGMVLLAGPAWAAKLTLTVWDWHEPRLTLIKEFAADYVKEHPDVEFEFSLQPWDEYWSKLPVAIAAGTPPDIVEFHNEKTDQFVKEGLLAPFPEVIFPRAEMSRKYFLYDAGFVLNGRTYYQPAGIMTPAIYYNRDILDRAGVASVPPSWAEFLDVARKLTQRDASGRLTQVGFQWAGDLQFLFTDLVYQQGGFLFDDDGVALGSDAGRRAMGIVEQLLSSDVGPLPGQPAPGSFEQGKVAMKYSWTWYTGPLQNYPGLNWAVALLPTPDGTGLPARARNNYECDLAVPAGLPPERQEAAFRFIKWLYDNDEFNLRINQALGRVPGRMDLWRTPALQRDPVFQLLVSQVPYTVYPGPLPSWLFPEVLGPMQERILSREMAPQTALERAVVEGNAAFRELPPEFIVERQYRPPRT
ncbi:MAG TPA: extracellular solute-binding protein [Limnochordia bacterium]